MAPPACGTPQPPRLLHLEILNVGENDQISQSDLKIEDATRKMNTKMVLA